VLGVTSKKRMRSAPDVPTIAETVPGFEVTSWYGVLGPPGLPEPVVVRLNGEINKVMNQPEMAKRLLALDLEAASGSASQFGEFIRQNTAMWAKVIKDAHVERE
jgi:tripartite-type tricarboxylate transporter receptor subunit TctC